MPLRLLPLLLLALCATALPAASADRCPRDLNLAVFGDFLSANDKANPTWPHYLNPKVLRYYADPAATATPPSDLNSSNPSSTLDKQLVMFIDEVHSSVIRGQIAAALWIGMNDLLNTLHAANFSNASSLLIAASNAGMGAGQNTCAALQSLAKDGVRHLFVFSLPDAQQFPLLWGDPPGNPQPGGAQDSMQLGVYAFNDVVAPAICTSASFRVISGHDVFSKAMAAAQTAGRPWSLGPCAVALEHNSSACDAVVWYDPITPTTAFQALMAAAIGNLMCGSDDGGMTFPTDSASPTATLTMTATKSSPKGSKGDPVGTQSPRPSDPSIVVPDNSDIGLLWLLLLMMLPMIFVAGWILGKHNKEDRRRSRRAPNAQLSPADLDPTEDLGKDRSVDTACDFTHADTDAVCKATSSSFQEAVPLSKPVQPASAEAEAAVSPSGSLDANVLSPSVTMHEGLEILLERQDPCAGEAECAQSSCPTPVHNDPAELKGLQSFLQSAGDTTTAFATMGGTYEQGACGMQLPLHLDMDFDLPEVQVAQHRKGLGAGANGQVYTGTHLTKGTTVAIKVIAARPDSIPRVKQEIHFLYKMQHDNIVKCFGYFLSADSINIVMEYVPRTLGQAIQELHRAGCMAEAVIKDYTTQILRGTQYIHSCNVVHRDLKPANVLVDTCGTCKIADFGCSKELSAIPAVLPSCVGTPQYMAPELMFLGTSHFGSDVWSIACIAYEMITGRAPWYYILENSEVRTAAQFFIQVARVRAGPLRPEDHITPDAADFLTPCFAHEPEDRPACAALLEKPWLAGDAAETPLAP